MGGVGRHDQFCLQRYAPQTKYRFRKYYKSVLIELLGVGILNAFITHPECAKRAGLTPLKRADVMVDLDAQMIKLTASDLAAADELSLTDTPMTKQSARTGHTLGQNEDCRWPGKTLNRQPAQGSLGQVHAPMCWNKHGSMQECLDIWRGGLGCKVSFSATSGIQRRPTTEWRKPKSVRRALTVKQETKSVSEYEVGDGQSPDYIN